MTFHGTGFENRVSGVVWTRFSAFALVAATMRSLTVKVRLRREGTGINLKHKAASSYIIVNILWYLQIASEVRDLLWIFVTSLFFTARNCSPTPNTNPQDHLLSVVCDCLSNTFGATLHIWRPSPPSAAWGRAMPWWQGKMRSFITCTLRQI
jgi:hypothetical protein